MVNTPNRSTSASESLSVYSTRLTSRRLKQFLGGLIFYATLCAIAFVILIPLLWMLSTSFKVKSQAS